MATATERLALLITANGDQAIRELGKVGATAKRDIGDAENRVQRLSGSLTSMGAGAVAAGATVASGLYAAVQAAQGLADSVDKADAVFGSSKGLEQYASGAAESMGRSKEAALDAATAYGALLKQSGLSGSALASSSSQLAQRTADLAERFKKPYEEVQAAIESVIKTGSSKALKGLLGVGIQIDPAGLKDLSTAEKTTTVLNEILRQTADSAGFFAAQTDDAGARFAVAQAKMKNAVAQFGESAIPVFATVADGAAKLLDRTNDLPGPLKNAAGGVAAIGSAAAIGGGSLAVLVGQLLKLKELTSAGGAGAAAGPVAAIVAAAAAGAALQGVISSDLASAAEDASASMEDFKRSLPTNDLEALGRVVTAVNNQISEGPDTTVWQYLQRTIAAAATSMGILAGSSSRLIDAISASDQATFQIETLQTTIDNFKQSLAGVEPDVAKSRIEAFIASLAGGVLPYEALITLQVKLLEEFAKTGPAADSAASYIDKVGTAAEEAATSFEQFKTATSALDSVNSSAKRLQQANENLAKLGQRDSKTVESSYQRIIDAKQRLDDILAGDGNSLDQESPAAQEARARAKLADANVRLAANRNDASAQTQKDEAIADIEAAQRRGQELARSAVDTARQVRDANEELASAQADYAEAVKPPSQDEINAAWAERADAELGMATSISQFAEQVADGKISFEQFKAYLDDLVSGGLISPDTAQTFKDRFALMGAAVENLTAKFDGLADRVPAYVAEGGQPGNNETPAQRAARLAAREIFATFGTKHVVNASELAKLGGKVPANPKAGAQVRDRSGHVWTYEPPGRWISTFHNGGMVGGMGEVNARLLGGEYVVSRRGVKALDQINSGNAPGGATWNVTNHIYGQRDPNATAVATVSKMRAKAFLRTGA